MRFKGFVLKRSSIEELKKEPRQLTDDDFQPDFRQKGVDMRIGLDVASYSMQAGVNEICVISNDADLIPAMKLARKNGKIVSCALFKL